MPTERMPSEGFSDEAPAGDLDELIDLWCDELRAGNKSARTLETYEQSARNMRDYLTANEMPLDVADIEATHLRRWLAHLGDTRSESTVSVRYRAVQQFWKFMVREGEIDQNPMHNIAPPTVPEKQVPTLTVDQCRALLKACAGKGFDDLRDTAVIRLFLDSGIRLAEMTGLGVDDVDFDQDVVVVLGKGRRQRAAPFGPKTRLALRRYLRARNKHDQAHRPQLWIGQRGPVTTSGIRQIVRRRGRASGIDGLHAHQLRHTFAHLYKVAGGSDDSLMRLAGWRSRQMLNRYGASAADQRSLEEYRRLGIGEDL